MQRHVNVNAMQWHVNVNAMQWHVNVFRGESVPSRAEKQQRIRIKYFYSNTSYGFKYKNLYK